MGIWPEEMFEHFKFCGEVKRITIKVDKQTGIRTGYAYVDFADALSAEAALTLDNSEFFGRILKVSKKRPKQYNNDFGKNGGKGGKNGGGKGWNNWGGGWNNWNGGGRGGWTKGGK